MPNFRIIHPNDADDAVLTASPAMVAALPVGNLQVATRASMARSVGLPAPQYVRGNFNEVKQITSMALARHNLTAAATIRLKLWNDLNQTGALNYDSGVVALGNPLGWGDFPWGLAPWGGDAFSDWQTAFVSLWFVSAVALSFELQWSDSANPAGYMECSRLFLGAYWSPAANMSYGHSMMWDENSTQERTEGGTLRTDGDDPFRRWEIDLGWLTQGERAQLTEIARRAGKREDFFFSAFPTEGGAKERDYAGPAKFVNVPGVTHTSAVNWRSKDRLIIEEA
jgi:hypothetical protein